MVKNDVRIGRIILLTDTLPYLKKILVFSVRVVMDVRVFCNVIFVYTKKELKVCALPFAEALDELLFADNEVSI